MRYRVVLVPFPFDDLTGSKVRPAVCLTDAVGAHRHVVLAFITSVVPPQVEATDLLLEPGSADFARTPARALRVAFASHGHDFGEDHSPAIGSPYVQPAE